MAINSDTLNIMELINSQQLAANLIGDTDPSKAGNNGDENGYASKILDLLQLIRADMQSNPPENHAKHER